MKAARRRFQGTWNIIRFNWHFYFLALIFVLILLNSFLIAPYRFFAICLAWMIFATTLISLIVSFYVYDLSDFYELDWLDDFGITAPTCLLNIHAGFDETSVLLKSKFGSSQIQVLDFYDPAKHTELSIQRARKAYPPFPGTQKVSSRNLPLQNDSIDQIYVIFAAHEIRDKAERHQFFKELERILTPDGKIIIVEHLRDFPNLIAYSIGFFHFMPKASWLECFKVAELILRKEKKITPFVTAFLLEKNGITS